MRARVLLWISLGLNALLGAALLYVARGKLDGVPVTEVISREPPAEKILKTNVVVRRLGFTWSEVESPDFATYIRNLKRIGCPDKTIRDIIIAEVNELFAERVAREISLPDQKWWLPDPDMDALEAAMDQVGALENEKIQLLTQLLGPGWDSQRSIASNVVRFDGPVLSRLPLEAKTEVTRIEANARRIRAEAEQRGADSTEIARLRQETRRQLAAVLSPEALEEYLLRYSHTAEQMREELRGFGADADEFRRIFRTRDSFDQQIAALAAADPATAARRAEIERLRDEAIQREIGSERFGLYQMSQSPLFRQAQEQAEQSGAPPEKVLPLFRIHQAAQDELARIQSDRTLSEDQKRIAMVTVQQQQRNSIDRILGNQPAEEMASMPAPGTPGEPAATVQATPIMPILPPLPPETFGAPARTRGPVNPRRR